MPVAPSTSGMRRRDDVGRRGAAPVVRRAGAVEHAVAQHETLDPRRARDALLELDDRRDRAVDRRRCVGEQRRVLLLDAVARRRVRERDALRHNAARAGGERRIDEDPRPLGPHAVVRVEQVGIRPSRIAPAAR